MPAGIVGQCGADHLRWYPAQRGCSDRLQEHMGGFRICGNGPRWGRTSNHLRAEAADVSAAAITPTTAATLHRIRAAGADQLALGQGAPRPPPHNSCPRTCVIDSRYEPDPPTPGAFLSNDGTGHLDLVLDRGRISGGRNSC